MPATVSLIAAMARDRIIGVRNTLPWRLPEDLQHFRKLTTGHPVIMGRKTFESLGRPLPDRANIVISRDRQLALTGCQVSHSLPDAIQLNAHATEVFIIGGAQIYQQAMPLAQRIYLTEIDLAVDHADAWFPQIDKTIWHEEQRESHTSNSLGCRYDFVLYTRTT